MQKFNDPPHIMSLYSAQRATLGELEGSGYAFLKLDAGTGKQYEGVFFTDKDHRDQLQSLTEEGVVSFTGTVYTKNRSGGVRVKQETVEVDVYQMVTVGVGERADFRVVES